MIGTYPLAIFATYCLFATRLHRFFVGPLQRVRPRNGIFVVVVLVLVNVLVPLRSEFIGEL